MSVIWISEHGSSTEALLLVDSGDGLAIPYVTEVPFLSAIGKQPGAKHGCTFYALITNASVGNPTGAIFAELQCKFL